MGFARIFVVLGILFLVLGGLMFVLARFGIQLGRLPGDFRFQSGNITCFFPLATTILLSLLLTIILNLVARLWK